MGKKKFNSTKSTKESNLQNLYNKFNSLPAKQNTQNTLIKGLVDTVAGSVVGTGIGALTGDKAAFAGIILILAGHYVGDESGLLRVTGASTLAYGIGKAKEYENNPELATPNQRLGALKDDWLSAFHLKWKKSTGETKNQSSLPNSENIAVTKESKETTKNIENTPPKNISNEVKTENLSNSLADEITKELGDDLTHI
ncbi:MAG: hypothetical protein H6598_04810 [Flavobacteriales bacterium]|nr:hypothetical protein [Flavobacteriales bacterium]